PDERVAAAEVEDQLRETGAEGDHAHARKLAPHESASGARSAPTLRGRLLRGALLRGRLLRGAALRRAAFRGALRRAALRRRLGRALLLLEVVVLLHEAEDAGALLGLRALADRLERALEVRHLLLRLAQVLLHARAHVWVRDLARHLGQRLEDGLLGEEEVAE